MIPAKGIDRARLDAILAEDPFNAVAHYEVTDFSATTAAAGFEALAGL